MCTQNNIYTTINRLCYHDILPNIRKFSAVGVCVVAYGTRSDTLIIIQGSVAKLRSMSFLSILIQRIAGGVSVSLRVTRNTYLENTNSKTVNFGRPKIDRPLARSADASGLAS
jgi:hypothetical protein